MTEPSNIIPISGALSPHQCEMRAADDAAAAALLETLANEITAANQKAKGASKASLTHYRTVGEKLNAAKIAAGHGNFGAWAEGKGFKSEWRRCLMHLAKHWDVLEPYLEGDGWEGVGYSVKEACGIIDRLLGRGAESKTDKQEAPSGEPQPPARKKSENAPAGRACRNRSDTITSASQRQPSKLATVEEENVRLSAELKAANERIDTLLWENAKLESEVADLKANEAKSHSGGFLMEMAAAGTSHLPV